MRRDDHTHTLEIEIAEKADVLEGTNQVKFVVPSSLGSAAAFDSDFFATAEQGRKIDEVHERLNDAHAKATQAKQTSDDVIQTAREAKASADAAVATANEAKEASEESKVSILLNKKAIDDLKGEIPDKAAVQRLSGKVNAIDQAVQGLGELSKKNKVTLDDLEVDGNRTDTSVLSGSGWVAMPQQIQPAAAQILSPELEERVQKVEEKADQNAEEITNIKNRADEARERAISADAKITALEAISTDSDQAKRAAALIQEKIRAAETASNEAKDICNEAKANSDRNKADIENLRTKVNDVEGKVDDSISRATRAETAATEANARVVEASNNASEAKTAAQQAQGQITQVGNRVTAVEEQLRNAPPVQPVVNVEECCEDLKKEVAQAKGLATAAQTAARNANSAITAAGVNAENALKKSTDAENKVQELGGKIKKCCDEFETAKADLESKIDHNKDEITAVKATAEAATASANASKAVVDGALPRLTAVEAKATTLEGKVTTVEGKVTAAEAKVTAAEGKVTELEGKVTASDAKVTALEGKVDAIEKQPPVPPAPPAAQVDFYTENDMGNQAKFEKLIEENHAKVKAVQTQIGLQPHATAGIDDDARWTAVEGYKNKPTAWIKDLKDLAVQVTDATVHTLYHQKKLTYLEDVINMSHLTVLSHHTPFLQPHENDRRKLVLKAGTIISFDIEQKLPHLVFNKDHEISHGVGGRQQGFSAGRDYYVFVLIDWDSPTREVTFAIQDSATPPAGYNQTNSGIIGGFHTLCVDAGVLSRHPLSGYVAGDILPKSIWALNHMPKCSPLGMVYHSGRDFWVDIYPASYAGENIRSKYMAVIASSARNPSLASLLKVGKRLLTDDEFIAAVDGTPSGCKTSGRVSSAGGHTGTNRKRIISNIGVEDGFGVVSVFLQDVCTVYNPNATGGAKHEMRTFAAGGSFSVPSPSPFFRNGGLIITQPQSNVGVRGMCESRKM